MTSILNPQNSVVITPLAVNEETAAKMLGICPRKLVDLRTAGAVRAIKIGRSLRYPVTELQEFINRMLELVD